MSDADAKMLERAQETELEIYAQGRFLPLPPDWWDERGIAADILLAARAAEGQEGRRNNPRSSQTSRAASPKEDSR